LAPLSKLFASPGFSIWLGPGNYAQGGGKGGIILRAPHHYGGDESLWGLSNVCGVAEKFQQFYKYFLQYSKLPSERPQVRTWGRQTCFLCRSPSNLVTPLLCLLQFKILLTSKITKTNY